MMLYRLTDKRIINLGFLVAAEWVEAQGDEGEPAKILAVRLAASASGEPFTYYISGDRATRVWSFLVTNTED